MKMHVKELQKPVPCWINSPRQRDAEGARYQEFSVPGEHNHLLAIRACYHLQTNGYFRHPFILLSSNETELQAAEVRTEGGMCWVCGR